MPKFFLEDSIPNKPSLFRRLIAFIIDCVASLSLATIIYYFWGPIIFAVMQSYAKTNPGMSFIGWSEAHASKTVILVLAFFFIFFRDLISGRGLGKRTMKLVIVHKSSRENARYAQTFLRSMIPFTFMICVIAALIKTEFMLIILTALVGADFVLITTQKNHRGLGDFLTDTIVMIERRAQDRPRKDSKDIPKQGLSH